MCQPSSFYTRSKFLLWRRNGVVVWGREVSWHPFLPVVSIIFLHSTFASNISTMCAHRTRLTFRVHPEQQYGFTSNRVKSTLRTSSGTIQDAYVLSFFWTRVWLSWWTWRSFVKLCFVIHCALFTPRLLVCFHAWVCSLLNFYLFYFQAVNDWRQENQENTRRSKGFKQGDEEKVKNSIWEFG